MHAFPRARGEILASLLVRDQKARFSDSPPGVGIGAVVNSNRAVLLLMPASYSKADKLRRRRHQRRERPLGLPCRQGCSADESVCERTRLSVAALKDQKTSLPGRGIP